jgi:hypothetical protein
MMRKSVLGALAAMCAAGAPASAQNLDWTVTRPPGWEFSTPVLKDGNVTFSVAPSSAAALQPVTFKGVSATHFCNDPVTTCTWPYTVNSLSSALLIEVSGDAPACWGGTSYDDISGVTFDGVAATLLAKRVSNIGQRFHYVYGLLNPHVGQHTITVNSTNAHQFRTSAADYAGVSGFGATVVSAHPAGSCAIDTSLTTILTTTAANSGVFLSANFSVNGSVSATGATLRGDPAASYYVWNFDSGAPIAASGASHSITVNAPGSGQSQSHIAVELKN